MSWSKSKFTFYLRVGLREVKAGSVPLGPAAMGTWDGSLFPAGSATEVFFP